MTNIIYIDISKNVKYYNNKTKSFITIVEDQELLKNELMNPQMWIERKNKYYHYNFKVFYLNDDLKNNYDLNKFQLTQIFGEYIVEQIIINAQLNKLIDALCMSYLTKINVDSLYTKFFYEIKSTNDLIFF